MSEDIPLPPCEPACSFSEPGLGVDIEMCEVCGSVWVLRDVTEVDPVTFQPTRIERGWIRR